MTALESLNLELGLSGGILIPQLFQRSVVPAALYRLLGGCLLCLLLATCTLEGTGPALRPTEGRLVGLAYAPYLPAGKSREVEGAELRELRVMAEQAASGAEKLRFLALSAILGEKIQDAVDSLEKATQKNAKSARAWSDLSAAYLHRAAINQEPYDAVLALSAADEAIARDGSLLEAHFNRALAFEDIGFSWQARSAWLQYVEIEPRSQWRREAERRLSKLRGPPTEMLWREARQRLEAAALQGNQEEVDEIVDRFRLRARRFGEEDLLALWAESYQRHPRRAESYLLIAASIGRFFKHKAGDEMLFDAVATIRTAKDLQVLAEGHLAYQEGVRLYEKHQIDGAWVAFGEARDKLSRSGSPIALWATLFAAGCEYQRHRYPGASRILDAVEQKLGLHNYSSLMGRILWMRGLIVFVQSHYELAQQIYLQALKVFERTGERENVAAIRLLLSEHFYVTGEVTLAWRELREALNRLDEIDDPRLRQVILWTGGIL